MSTSNIHHHLTDTEDFAVGTADLADVQATLYRSMSYADLVSENVTLRWRVAEAEARYAQAMARGDKALVAAAWDLEIRDQPVLKTADRDEVGAFPVVQR